MSIGASNTGVLEQAVQEVRAALDATSEMEMGNEREGTDTSFCSSAQKLFQGSLRRFRVHLLGMIGLECQDCWCHHCSS